MHPPAHTIEKILSNIRRTGSGLLIDIWKTKKRMLALINILSILFPQANSNTTFGVAYGVRVAY